MLIKEEIEKAKRECKNLIVNLPIFHLGGGKYIKTLLQYIDELEQEIQSSKFVHECDIDRIYRLEQEKESTYWKGYIKKQQEAMEICKMCKYRKQYFERNVKEHE